MFVKGLEVKINSINPDISSLTYTVGNRPLDFLSVCDILPPVNTFFNIAHIVCKTFYYQNLDPFIYSHYKAYLSQKSLSRCLITAIPILGNVAEVIYQIAIRVFGITFSTKADILHSLKTNPEGYQYIESSHQDDKDIAEELFQNNGHLLRFAGKNVKKDKRLVEIALANCPEIICYADISIRSNKSLILSLLKTNTTINVSNLTTILTSVSDTLRQDEEIALAIINHRTFHETHIFLLDRSLNKNKTVMLALVTKFPECIRYASKELQDDQELKNAAKAH